MITLRTTSAVAPPSFDERDAHIVVDLRDPAWPVIRYIDSDLVDRRMWHLAETRAFFAARAGTWDAKFGADLPAYTEAVGESRIPPAASSSMWAAEPVAHCQHCDPQ